MNGNRNQHQNDDMKEITNKLNPCQIKGTLNTFTITKTFHCLSISIRCTNRVHETIMKNEISENAENEITFGTFSLRKKKANEQMESNKSIFFLRPLVNDCIRSVFLLSAICHKVMRLFDFGISNIE